MLQWKGQCRLIVSNMFNLVQAKKKKTQTAVVSELSLFYRNLTFCILVNTHVNFQIKLLKVTVTY